MLSGAMYLQNGNEVVVYVQTHGVIWWILVGLLGGISRREIVARAWVWMRDERDPGPRGGGGGRLGVWDARHRRGRFLGKFGGGDGGGDFAGGGGEVVCGWEWIGVNVCSARNQCEAR